MMLSKKNSLKIDPIFTGQSSIVNKQAYIDIIRSILEKLLAGRAGICSDLFFEGATVQREQFLSLLPIVSATKCVETPGSLSYYALSRERTGVFKFFFDMVSGWLIPGKRMNVPMIYSADFRLPDISDDIYTLCEVRIRVETKRELEQILDNVPWLEAELQMGLASSHYARRVLEIKGFSTDEKTALIHEQIAYLIDKMPTHFDQDALTEMQHVLLICREDFKADRSCRHLSRIIGIHYLFRQWLRDDVRKSPEKRHIKLKMFRGRLPNGETTKTVMAVLVGVNFFREKEVLYKTELLNAIQSHIPDALAIENSFFSNRRGSDPVCTMYMEIEKSNGRQFSPDEIRLLRRELPRDLKNQIRHLLHPVFMPRNEEEIIRNILSLSTQIKYLRDIPQVYISFDEQTHGHVFFTIILVRVARPDNISIQEMFKKSSTCLEYIHDRVQNAGSLRRKHKKEATVFRVKLAKEQYLRADHTIDLNRARQTVVAELFNIVGDIRDFNGGMISKQNEILIELKGLLQNDIKYNDLLLENFFYSLTPVIMRNVLETEALRTLFLLLLGAIEDKLQTGKSYTNKFINDEQFVFVMIKADDRSIKDEMTRALNKLQLHSSQVATVYVPVDDAFYLGYLYRSDDPSRQNQFTQFINQTLASWEVKKLAQNVLASPASK